MNVFDNIEVINYLKSVGINDLNNPINARLIEKAIEHKLSRHVNANSRFDVAVVRMEKAGIVNRNERRNVKTVLGNIATIVEGISVRGGTNSFIEMNSGDDFG
jgi:hypothetical protein